MWPLVLKMLETEWLKPNTYKIGDEEANQALIHSINHIHPKHVWLVLLRHKKTLGKSEPNDNAVCWDMYFVRDIPTGTFKCLCT